MSFKKVDPKELSQNIFSLLSDEWAILSAGTPDEFNIMTVSWGFFGILWNKPCAEVFIRPQRHTLEFIERGGVFTLSFFGKGHREALALCGSKSGKDVDKVRETGLTTVISESGGIFFDEAEKAVVLRKLYSDKFRAENFVDNSINDSVYKENDHHNRYIGEIIELLIK